MKVLMMNVALQYTRKYALVIYYINRKFGDIISLKRFIHDWSPCSIYDILKYIDKYTK